MNASNGSGVGSPRDRPAIGWVSPHPLGWGGSYEAAVVASDPSPSSGTSPRNDPRVIAALEAYLDALRAGRPWSREEFLARLRASGSIRSQTVKPWRRSIPNSCWRNLIQAGTPDGRIQTAPRSHAGALK